MRKIDKKEWLYIVKLIFTWILIDVAANLFGLWISKLLNEAEYTYPDSIFNEFTRPIFFQSLLFGICIVLGTIFIKKKKVVVYTFSLLQVLIFHFIFLINLRINHGIHFVSAFKNWGVQYLSSFGQYLVDILYLRFPINGNFSNEVFAPDNLGTFYLHWIFLNLVYYFAISWVAVIATKFLFETKLKNLE